MSAEQYYAVIEKAYLAYYGRPSDIGGLAYWSARLDQKKGNLSGMIDAFANSAEAQQLYGGLDNATRIDKIYQQLFGRHADDGGLKYYLGQLQSGKMTLGSIMLNVADGATNQDATLINTHVNQHLASYDASQLSSLVKQYQDMLTPKVDPAYGLYVTLGEAAIKWEKGLHLTSPQSLDDLLQKYIVVSGNQETIKGLMTLTINQDGTMKVDFANPVYHDWKVSMDVAQKAFEYLSEDSVALKYAGPLTYQEYQQGLQEMGAHFDSLYAKLPAYDGFWIS